MALQPLNNTNMLSPPPAMEKNKKLNSGMFDPNLSERLRNYRYFFKIILGLNFVLIGGYTAFFFAIAGYKTYEKDNKEGPLNTHRWWDLYVAASIFAFFFIIIIFYIWYYGKYTRRPNGIDATINLVGAMTNLYSAQKGPEDLNESMSTILTPGTGDSAKDEKLKNLIHTNYEPISNIVQDRVLNSTFNAVSR